MICFQMIDYRSKGKYKDKSKICNQNKGWGRFVKSKRKIPLLVMQPMNSNLLFWDRESSANSISEDESSRSVNICTKVNNIIISFFDMNAVTGIQ